MERLTVNGFTQRHRKFSLSSAVLAVILLLTAVFRNAPACPFCLSPPQTLAEQISRADIVLIAELIRFRVLDNGSRPESTLRIRKYVRGEEIAGSQTQMQIGQPIVIATEAAGVPGDLFLMYGTLPEYSLPKMVNASEISGGQSPSADPQAAGKIVQAVLKSDSAAPVFVNKAAYLIPELISWNETLAISSDMVSYLEKLPDQSASQPSRLAFFLTYLEHHDPLIAIDAWAEFGNATYKDVVAVKDLMSPKDLRRWIANKEMTPERLGLYGMMLGLSGGPEDAQFLLNQMMEYDASPKVSNDVVPAFRFGAEGLMGGYLLLTGEEGLRHLESTIALPDDIPDTARHAFVQSLQFMWSYENAVISKVRIQSSMRLLLKNNTMREIAVTNLSRWEDWESLPMLTTMFAHECHNDRESQRAILQFAQTCQRSASANADGLEYASMAEEFLCETQLQCPDLFGPNVREFTGPQ